MKVLLISICLLVSSYGCSNNSPTSTELTLDTTTKESSGTFTITRWDGNNWIDTADKLTLSLTWKFISHIELSDGVRIKGGYTLLFSNPSGNDVEYEFSRFTFIDKDGIAIYEYLVSPRIRRRVVRSGTATYSSAFEIELDNIDLANQITEMGTWGSATIQY